MKHRLRRISALTFVLTIVLVAFNNGQTLAVPRLLLFTSFVTLVASFIVSDQRS